MSKPRRYHLNVVGPFYVAHDCCTTCGVPEALAPSLFGSDDAQCFVRKQPDAPGELAQMLETLRVQELGCIRYAGEDPNILETIRSWDDLPIVDARWWPRLRARLVGRKIP